MLHTIENTMVTCLVPQSSIYYLRGQGFKPWNNRSMKHKGKAANIGTFLRTLLIQEPHSLGTTYIYCSILELTC